MEKIRSKSSRKNSRKNVKPKETKENKSKKRKIISKEKKTKSKKINERKLATKKKSTKKVINIEDDEEEPVEISLDEKSQEENEIDLSEQIEEIPKSKSKQRIKETNKKRNNSISSSNKKLLNKKKLKSKSKPKNKSTSKKKEKFIKLSTPKKKKAEKFIELEPEESESEKEKENSDSSFSEEDNRKSKKKKVQSQSKSKSKSKSKTKPKKQKKDIQEINIDDYPLDNSLTEHNHDIIEDCCLSCNEKNIFRAIKTNDKDLFIKCLKSTDKISSIDYKLQIVGNLNPIEYIIQEKNKKLYTEYINFKKNPVQQQRVTLPKDKLSFINSGRNNIFTFGFNTRPVGLSRGNKLGNNAFIMDERRNEDFSILILSLNIKN